jgi:hypothetical protein
LFKIVKIEGDSLYPFLKNGQKAFCIRLFYFNNLKINDFVIFKHKTQGLMIKQITKIKNDKYYLKGTSSFSIDSRDFGYLDKEELLYKVLFKI